MSDFRNDVDYMAFMADNPSLDARVVDCKHISEWEIMLTMDNGETWVFNAASHHIRTVRNVENGPMSEEDWRVIFSRVLKARMFERRMNQQDLADAIGLSQSTVNKYINGKATPSVFTIRKLAKALRCSPLDLTEFPTY